MRCIILRFILAFVFLSCTNFKHYVYSAPLVQTNTTVSTTEEEEETKVDAQINDALAQAQQDPNKMNTGHSLPKDAKNGLEHIQDTHIGWVNLEGGNLAIFSHNQDGSISEYLWDGTQRKHRKTYTSNADTHKQIITISNKRDLNQLLDSKFHQHVPVRDLVAQTGITFPDDLHGKLSAFNEYTHHIVPIQSNSASHTSVLVFPPIGDLKGNDTINGEWFMRNQDGAWTKRDITLTADQGKSLVSRTTTKGASLPYTALGILFGDNLQLFAHQDKPAPGNKNTLMTDGSFDQSASHAHTTEGKLINLGRDALGAVGLSAGSIEGDRARTIEYINYMTKKHQEYLDALVAAHNRGGALSPEDVQKLINFRKEAKKRVRELFPNVAETVIHAYADWKKPDMNFTVNNQTSIQELNRRADSAFNLAGDAGIMGVITGPGATVMSAVKKIQPNEQQRDLYMGSLDPNDTRKIKGHVSLMQAEDFSKAIKQGKTVQQAIEDAGIQLYEYTAEYRRKAPGLIPKGTIYKSNESSKAVALAPQYNQVQKESVPPPTNPESRALVTTKQPWQELEDTTYKGNEGSKAMALAPQYNRAPKESAAPPTNPESRALVATKQPWQELEGTTYKGNDGGKAEKKPHPQPQQSTWWDMPSRTKDTTAEDVKKTTEETAKLKVEETKRNTSEEAKSKPQNSTKQSMQNPMQPNITVQERTGNKWNLSSNGVRRLKNNFTKRKDGQLSEPDSKEELAGITE